MRILIITGIYPPEIGGPAQYAKNLGDVWTDQGHTVSVKIFGKFKSYPWGIRHVLFFFYILPNVWRSDYVVALDSFSAGVVTLVSKIFSKVVVFRTGGDVVWELYTERTGDLVLLRDFYKTKHSLSTKERLMFILMKWTFRNLSAVIWSTEWQRDIFMEPYGLSKDKNFVVENYYGPGIKSVEYSDKVFIGTTRDLKWKNLAMLNKVFERNEVIISGASLYKTALNHDQFIDKIVNSYAVILVSLGDISPNMILDSIHCGKPFIVTKETGIYERIKDVAIFVNPKDEDDIAEKVLWLMDENNYKIQKQKVESFTFTHTWQNMAKEYIDIYNSIK